MSDKRLARQSDRDYARAMSRAIREERDARKRDSFVDLACRMLDYFADHGRFPEDYNEGTPEAVAARVRTRYLELRWTGHAHGPARDQCLVEFECDPRTAERAIGNWRHYCGPDSASNK